VVIDQLGEYCDKLVAICGDASKVGFHEWKEQAVANNACSCHIQILEPTFLSTCVDAETTSMHYVNFNQCATKSPSYNFHTMSHELQLGMLAPPNAIVTIEVATTVQIESYFITSACYNSNLHIIRQSHEVATP
jgi:hypothetical protein